MLASAMVSVSMDFWSRMAASKDLTWHTSKAGALRG